jgi:hypothetical protein
MGPWKAIKAERGFMVSTRMRRRTTSNPSFLLIILFSNLMQTYTHLVECLTALALKSSYLQEECRLLG